MFLYYSLNQIQNNFIEIILMMPPTKIDQNVQLRLITWPPELKIEISSNDISLATCQYIISMPQDSGERSRALGPSCLCSYVNVCMWLYYRGFGVVFWNWGCNWTLLGFFTHFAIFFSLLEYFLSNWNILLVLCVVWLNSVDWLQSLNNFSSMCHIYL